MQFSFLLLAISAIAAPVVNLREQAIAVIIQNQQLRIPLIESSITAAKSDLSGKLLEKANELHKNVECLSTVAQWKHRNKERRGEATLESYRALVQTIYDHTKRLEKQINSLVNLQNGAGGSSGLKREVKQRAPKAIANSGHLIADLKAPASAKSLATLNQAGVALKANANSRVALNQAPGAKLEAPRSEAHVSDFNMPTRNKADRGSKRGMVKNAAIGSIAAGTIAAGAVGAVAVRKHHLAKKEAGIAALASQESAPFL